MSFKEYKKAIGLLSGCMIAMHSHAGQMGPNEVTMEHPWSVTASLGFSQFQNMHSNDGDTAIGRLAIGRDVYQAEKLGFGLELGVQNGNAMRLSVPQESIDLLGGLPIQTTLKPVLDLQATIKTQPLYGMPVIAQLKGGIAYRMWQFDNRDSIANQSKIAGTVQAGLGYQINDRAMVNLMYQGVFGGNPHFSANANDLTGHVSNIPVQNGVLLGLNYAV
ncbi:MAG: hypothetical protein P4L65_00450 [Legionella sp.]|nr:hypothetical protein [Legionella sp.]